jgi:hypothetical protein
VSHPNGVIEFLNERMLRVRHFPGADGEAKASLCHSSAFAAGRFFPLYFA